MQIRAARREDAAGIARVQVDSWQTTYRGIVSDDFLQEMKDETYIGRWEHRLSPDVQMSVFVAETDAGEIVGFISGGRERSGKTSFDGEVYAIYTLQQHQQKGLGRRLLLTLAERLAADGFTSLLVWVLTENHPARAFYEKLGGTYVSEQKLELGGQLLDERSYGWTDIRTLRKSFLA